MPSDTPPERPDTSRAAAARRWLSRPRPVVVSLTSLGLGVEALVLVVLAVVGLLQLAGPDGNEIAVAATLVLCSAAMAWLLLVCAAALGSGRTWVRGPAVTVQLLALLVAYSVLGTGERTAAVAVGILAGATLVGLLTPAVARFTGRDAKPFTEE